MHNNSKGLFITFEGCEGSGKSTQSKLLHKWFLKNNINAILTREPGGTKTAEKIREIILDKDIKLETGSQLLLHFASRIEHFHDLIKPSIASKQHVICDRFLDSTVAYQHYGHGVNLEIIYKIHQVLLENITPDITFLLDIDIEDHKNRLAQRAKNNDRYENLNEDFHKKVIMGFRKIAQNYPKRCHIIDTTNSVNNTHDIIVRKIQDYIAKSD